MGGRRSPKSLTINDLGAFLNHNVGAMSSKKKNFIFMIFGVDGKRFLT
tara:strand:- start:446 stop:589 length:144 start_codon:yes stop_codon:yes gene_type:complete